MKQFWTMILCLFLMTGATTLFTACSNDKSDTGGGQQPEDNAKLMTGAYGLYFGGDMDPETGHYILALWSDGVVFDEGSWFCTGKGEFIWLDISAALAQDLKNVRLVPGTYQDAEIETFNEFTFQRGSSETGSIISAIDGEDEIADPIVKGELKIENDGKGYKIRLTAKTESGREESFRFAGELPVVLNGIGYQPDPFGGTFSRASADYYGDYYGAGTGNIQLVLSDIKVEEGEAIYPGHTLYLDMNTSLFTSQASIALAAGTYTCDKSGDYATPMTFNIGQQDEEEYLFGSLWVESRSDGVEEPIYRVTDGSFTVAGNGANYKITVSMKLDNGETRTGEYNGALQIQDGSCLTRLTGDVTTAFTKGIAMFFGDAQYYQNNSYHWVIALATDGVNLDNPGDPATKGEMLQVAFNTTRASTTEIPTGTYEVIQQINTEYLVPFTYIPGYLDIDRGVNGTWYFKDTKAVGPAVGGTLKIENKGSNVYSIEYDFVDDYYYTSDPHRISGNFEGTLPYSDYSNPYGAPAKGMQTGTIKPQAKFKSAKTAESLTRRTAQR